MTSSMTSTSTIERQVPATAAATAVALVVVVYTAAASASHPTIATYTNNGDAVATTTVAMAAAVVFVSVMMVSWENTTAQVWVVVMLVTQHITRHRGRRGRGHRESAGDRGITLMIIGSTAVLCLPVLASAINRSDDSDNSSSTVQWQIFGFAHLMQCNILIYGTLALNS